MKILRRPINCYNYRTRHKALISLHAVDVCTFILRFILVCLDLSKIQEVPLTAAYVVIILLLELMGSLPFFFSDILYFVTWCFKNELFSDDRHPICCRRRTILSIATLTCFRCHCYEEHPQGMQLTRVIILMCCYITRFIAFVLGASCATTFNPRCVPYTVISSFTLFVSFFTLVLEWFHFHLLWNFEPDVGNTLTNRRNRSHLRFIPDKLINTERINDWRTASCKYGDQCHANSLHHALLYHFIPGTSSNPSVPIENGERVIAYYATTNESAIDIAQNGFPVDGYRRLVPEICFTQAVQTWNAAGAGDSTAIICARLNVGQVLQVPSDSQFNFVHHAAQQHMPNTLQLLSRGLIKVHFPSQIENWVITLRTNTNETFDMSAYDGCI